MRSLKLQNNGIFILLFIISSILLHFKSYNQPPSKIHGWAQSDHYVLALGFIENNFDFFHPKTFTLNHQFKPKINLKNPKGITAVDFPIFHYIVAIAMKLLNSKAFWIYRLLMLFWSFISLFFLFRTINKLKGFWEALLITFFILLQPIYVYYQDGFHISMAAFNTLIIGFSYLLKHLYSKNKKHFILSIIFITIAALIRFTEVIFLIAVFSTYVVKIWKSKKFNYNIIWIILGLSIVIIYFIFNKSLANKYGTVFLNKPIVASSIKSLFIHFSKQFIMYLRGFLPFIHLTIIGLSFYYYKSSNSINTKINLLKPLLFFLILGTFIFNLLMSWSLSVHDYYSLDTWFPVILVLISYLIFNNDFQKEKILLPIITILFISGALSFTTEMQYWKYKYFTSENDKNMIDFKESVTFLEQIKPNTKTLIVARYGWNTPMIYWHKNAFRITSNYKEELPKFLDQKFDYIITLNSEYKDVILKQYPEFTNRTSKLASNGKVTIWKQNNY